MELVAVMKDGRRLVVATGSARGLERVNESVRKRPGVVSTFYALEAAEKAGVSHA